MASPRIVECITCQGEGRIIREEFWGYDPRTGDPTGHRSEEWCRYCEGTGGEIIETIPVECDDLCPMVPS